MTTIPRAPKDSFKPAFIVGVIGHMDLDPAHRDRVDAEVKRIFALPLAIATRTKTIRVSAQVLT
jgi:hypothetical protein